MAPLKAGTRLKSAVCNTEVMVIAIGNPDADLRCGGAKLLEAAAAKPEGGSPAPDHAKGSQLGKRYVDADGSIELLCTKPGAGSLSVGGTALGLKEAKPLPSSD
jgi:hypothetical protein